MAAKVKPFAAQLRAAERHLLKLGGPLAETVRRVGPCALPESPDVFATAVRAVIGQLISTAAAKSIYSRLTAAAGGTLTPESVLALSDDALKSCGVSGGKRRCVLGVARHFLDTPGSADFAETLRQSDDAAVRAMLLPLYGVGPWTVDMVLLFALGRLDTLPVGDLGLRVGVRDTFGLAELPGPKACEELTRAWRPYRGVATWYLWRGLEAG